MYRIQSDLVTNIGDQNQWRTRRLTSINSDSSIMPIKIMSKTDREEPALLHRPSPLIRLGRYGRSGRLGSLSPASACFEAVLPGLKRGCLECFQKHLLARFGIRST